MNYPTAHRIANEILAALAPDCTRIEIAGSVLREKPDDIHDVELVCISKPPVVAFGQPDIRPALHRYLDELLKNEVIDHRRDKNGRPAWGMKYRRCLWKQTPLDVFITTPEQWGIIFAMRVGCDTFSHSFVTRRQDGGLLPDHMRVSEGRLYVYDGLIATPEETDFFYAIGLPYLDPPERSGQWENNLSLSQYYERLR